MELAHLFGAEDVLRALCFGDQRNHPMAFVVALAEHSGELTQE